MDSIVFKKATQGDVAAVDALTKKAFAAYAKEIRKQDSVAALKETADEIAADILGKHVYLCMLDGQPAGAVRFEVLDQGIAYLSRLAIDPDVQSIGVGGLLLEKVRQELSLIHI